MQYVNVLLWVLIIVLITAVLCAGISILWVETQREKWFNEGRVFEREEKELKFKRTKGTRRVKVATIPSWKPHVFTNDFTIEAVPLSRVIKPPKPTVTKHKSRRVNFMEMQLDEARKAYATRPPDELEKAVFGTKTTVTKSKRERTK